MYSNRIGITAAAFLLAAFLSFPTGPVRVSFCPDAGATKSRSSSSPGKTSAGPTGYGRLRINTNPWTRIHVDGRYKGTTPKLNIKLRAGRHNLRLTRPTRGIAKTIIIYIRAGKTLTIVKDLRKGRHTKRPVTVPPPFRKGYGTFRINTKPYTRIYIDGRYRGVTPKLNLKLRAGRHRLRLVSPTHGFSKTFVIVIKAGKVLTFVRKLAGGGQGSSRAGGKRYGWLRLNTVPWTKFYIDGRFSGITPIFGILLRQGKHRLRLVNKPCGISQRSTILIKANKTLTIVKRLKARGRCAAASRSRRPKRLGSWYGPAPSFRIRPRVRPPTRGKRPSALTLAARVRRAWVENKCALTIRLGTMAYRKRPSSRVAMFVGTCACRIRQKQTAKWAYKRLTGGFKAMVRRACRAKGIDLR